MSVKNNRVHVTEPVGPTVNFPLGQSSVLTLQHRSFILLVGLARRPTKLFEF